MLSQYKAELKSSNYLSKNFLEGIQARYDSASTYLNNHHQIDGPVVGFETDPIIQLGEEGSLKDYIKNLKVSKVLFEDNYYLVKVSVSKY